MYLILVLGARTRVMICLFDYRIRSESKDRNRPMILTQETELQGMPHVWTVWAIESHLGSCSTLVSYCQILISDFQNRKYSFYSSCFW
jgi:hypothetical protein